MPTSAPLPRAEPAEHGLDPAAIHAFLDAVDEPDAPELHSLMVLRHGIVLAEGWWHPYGPDQLHLLHSLSKSFTSIAVGMAIDDGLLSTGDRIVDIFDDLADVAVDDRMRTITLGHCLQMATGHAEDTLPRARVAAPGDLVRGFLSVPPDEDPGALFSYNNGASFVAAAAVQRATGQRLTDFLGPRLFQPLGIDRLFWQTDAQGRTMGYTGLHLTTDSLARFGQLILQRGRWQHRQLISAEWIDRATDRQTDTGNQSNPDWRQGYGFQFWRSRHGFRGDGAYGQFCLLLPEQDVVIATTAATTDLQRVLDIVWDRLLPGLGSPTDTTDPTLAQRLDTLTVQPVGAAGWTPAPIPEPEPGSGQPADPVRVTKITDLGDDQLEIILDHDQIAGAGQTAPLGYRCGLGHWAVDGHRLEGADLPYAGSAHRSADGTLDAEIALLQTAHRIRIRQHPDGRTESGWLTQPRPGPYPEQLAIRPQ